MNGVIAVAGHIRLSNGNIIFAHAIIAEACKYTVVFGSADASAYGQSDNGRNKGIGIVKLTAGGADTGKISVYVLADAVADRQCRLISLFVIVTSLHRASVAHYHIINSRRSDDKNCHYRQYQKKYAALILFQPFYTLFHRKSTPSFMSC